MGAFFGGGDLGLCGYTRTQPVPAGTGRVGYEIHGYGSGTGTELRIRVRAGMPILLAKILLFLPHAVWVL